MTRAQRASRERNFRNLFWTYKRSAKKRNLPFTLSIERFRELTRSKCFLCGAKPQARYFHSKKKKSFSTPYVYVGVDRMENREGYSDSNCAPCCRKCNYTKGTLSIADFLLYVHRVYEHAIRPAMENLDGQPRPNPDDQ